MTSHDDNRDREIIVTRGGGGGASIVAIVAVVAVVALILLLVFNTGDGDSDGNGGIIELPAELSESGGGE